MTGFLLGLTVAAAMLAGGAVAAERAPEGRRFRPDPVVLAVFVLTAAPSLLQFPFPVIFDALRRDPVALARGEWWRMVTPLVVQDGGVAGTVFNLVALLALGTVAARVLGPRRWLALYLGAGVAAEAVAYAWVDQGFAGNSIANFGVAAGLALAALRTRRPRRVAAGIVTLLGGAALLARGDLHGAAFLIGLLLAFALLRVGSAPRVNS